jgi:hypothetical protein
MAFALRGLLWGKANGRRVGLPFAEFGILLRD